MSQRRFALSGRMFSGKDFIANTTGLSVLGFADPIYELCEHLIGSRNKSVPGVRQTLQQLGQWGWGCISEAYPLSVSRGELVRRIQTQGHTMTQNFGWVDWSEFGKRTDFWVNILLTRLGLTENFHQLQLELIIPPQRIAVTNVRFEHELQPLVTHSFAHYHVRCSEHTRQARMLMKGYDYNATEDRDASEALAARLDEEMPDHMVVWNDFSPCPRGRRYLTVDDFRDVVCGQGHFCGLEYRGAQAVHA